MTRKKSKTVSTPAPFKCVFCKKGYKLESAFHKHKCEKRSRFLEKDTHYARLAYDAYCRWHAFNMPHVARDPESFRNSAFYKQFITFGRWLVDKNPISASDFISYMVRQVSGVNGAATIPLQDWCKDIHYTKYRTELYQKEDCWRAVERTLQSITSWLIKYDPEGSPTDFFAKVATPLAILWIQSGKISPWVLFNCNSGKALVNDRLDAEQVNIMSDAINVKFWLNKFKQNTEDARKVCDFLEKEGF